MCYTGAGVVGVLHWGWCSGSTVSLEVFVWERFLTEQVDVVVKLEKLVCPSRTEKHHHAAVYQEVEDQVDR